MQEQSDFTFQAERFADIQLLRYQVPGFKELTLRQKLLIYHLSRAALLGRDILWDQNGAYNLRIRQVLETIYTQYQGNRNTEDFQQFTTYLKRVWFSNGIHHHYGYQKFTPGFSENFFTDAAEQLGLDVEDLLPIIFDPSVLSKRVNQTEGADLLLTSASNYYQDGITQAEAEDFYVDATAMYLITRPQSFEVIVTTNLFGDILSDEGAGLVGGLGMIPSGNIGKDGALFEPVHGSAPDIAGQGIANPFAMMLSACMMLNYLEEYEAEEKLNSAILEVLNEAKYLTPDLGGNSKTMDVSEAVKTKIMG